jgi:uncharacterized ferritin-like protein (DUF455 family)
MKRSELRNQIEEIIVELLDEHTIDVPNPNALTDKQKQDMIQKAKVATKDPKIGTPENPVDFV